VFRPRFGIAASRRTLAAYARAISRARKIDEYEEAVDEVRCSFVENLGASRHQDRQVLLAALLVLADLATQGWHVRVRRGVVEVRAPAPVGCDRAAEKARIRRQELVKRNAQLREAAVEDFVRSMERSRLFNGRFTSVFSLMRDGRERADALRAARACDWGVGARHLAGVVNPYLEFVRSDESVCSFTGLRLMDIWRYFRHTWTNQYSSVPGRSMMFLVRDRAAPLHPVVGIGAISSPVMQIRERDIWIGWHPDAFLASIKANPTGDVARWLIDVVDSAVGEIYVDDFVEEGVVSVRDLTNPSEAAIDALLKKSEEQRIQHYRYARSRDHKGQRSQAEGSEYWVQRARTHLFRSKRALALASYLRARAVLRDAFSAGPTRAKLAALASTGRGAETIRKIVKKAKADRIGIAVGDITVCGAVQPYNAILGGKLVAMLSIGPEVVGEYRRRYSKAESEIASAMAGRAIIRTPALVLLTTTSLYGVGSSQYNRVRIPCEQAGGNHGEVIGYEEVGRSEAFGTSQYSEQTVEALTDLIQQSANGRRVNSIFGEGVSPKFRKVREGLDAVGLSSDALLRHHRARVVYAVSLVRNLREYLLGIESDAKYLVPTEDGHSGTDGISAWWRGRWLWNRIKSEDVLADVARHTLIRPVRHGGRVLIQSSRKEEALSEE
jgi:uncharacterized protein DUF4338